MANVVFFLVLVRNNSVRSSIHAWHFHTFPSSIEIKVLQKPKPLKQLWKIFPQNRFLTTKQHFNVSFTPRNPYVCIYLVISKIIYFYPYLEIMKFDEHIFQMDWHQNLDEIYTPPKFNTAPEKTVVGRLYTFLLEIVTFQGRAVKLREGIPWASTII